jgi:hypothetical protein
MLVKQLNQYFNKGLCIMSNKRGSICIALEALCFLIYAWKLCPVPGTDISYSLVAVSHEFPFPINFSKDKHWELTLSPSTIKSYSTDLANRIRAYHEIACFLVSKHCTWHRELINSHHCNPHIFHVGDIVFAQWATHSDAARGQVSKLKFAFTGPWQMMVDLPGGFYAIKHCHHPNQDKKHALSLTPYPNNLIPFQPIDGPDSQFSQLYPIGEHPLLVLLLAVMH